MCARGRILLIAATLCGLPVAGGAQAPTVTNGREGYDELLARYLQDARDMAVRDTQAGMSWSWMNGLELDTRARQINDLLTIQVVENTTASGSADAALAKDSGTSASVGSFFGLEKKLPSLINPTALAGSKRDQSRGTVDRESHGPGR
jgi:flagellar basal body L-ring protein FlgH